MTKLKHTGLHVFLIVFPFVFQALRELFAYDVLKFEEMALLGIISELVALLVLAVLYGRVYCGILCQVGAVQRVANLVGGKVLKKRFIIPKNTISFYVT